METPWRLREEDEEFFSKQLNSFIPERVYDIHAHLWRISDWEGRPPEIVQAAASEISLERYREYMAWIFPGREVHGLHFAYPAAFPNAPDPCNAWVSGEVRKDPLARGQYYVRPTDAPDRTREEVKRLGLRGFKPFANFSGRPDIENAEIPEDWSQLASDILAVLVHGHPDRSSRKIPMGITVPGFKCLKHRHRLKNEQSALRDRPTGHIRHPDTAPQGQSPS